MEEILVGVLTNLAVGVAVFISLDTDDYYLSWLKKDPTDGIMVFIALSLWPMMAFYMIRYKIEKRRWKK